MELNLTELIKLKVIKSIKIEKINKSKIINLEIMVCILPSLLLLKLKRQILISIFHIAMSDAQIVKLNKLRDSVMEL